MWESLGWVFPLQSLNLTLPQALNGKGQASGLTESRPAAETYWNMLRSAGACGRWGKSTCSYRVYLHICVGTAGVWIHIQSHLQGAVRKWRKVNWRRKHPDVEWGWPTLDASCGGRYKGWWLTSSLTIIKALVQVWSKLNHLTLLKGMKI